LYEARPVEREIVIDIMIGVHRGSGCLLNRGIIGAGLVVNSPHPQPLSRKARGARTWRGGGQQVFKFTNDAGFGEHGKLQFARH
jgi:hypothetical protein